jgi:hypothetical protein
MAVCLRIGFSRVLLFCAALMADPVELCAQVNVGGAGSTGGQSVLEQSPHRIPAVASPAGGGSSIPSSLPQGATSNYSYSYSPLPGGGAVYSLAQGDRVGGNWSQVVAPPNTVPYQPHYAAMPGAQSAYLPPSAGAIVYRIPAGRWPTFGHPAPLRSWLNAVSSSNIPPGQGTGLSASPGRAGVWNNGTDIAAGTPPWGCTTMNGVTTCYQPVIELQNLPPGAYSGRNWLGQPKLYRDGQPIRNLVRYLQIF